MKFSPQQYARALFEAFSEASPKDHDKVMDNFVKILAQNGDLGRYGEIETEFRKLRLESQGIKEVEVTVAQDMEFSQTVIQELNKAVGGKLEIKKKVDESLIGGMMVRVDDTLIDASVKTQLGKLNRSLKS